MVGCSQSASNRAEIEWTPDLGPLPSSLENLQSVNKSNIRVNDRQIGFQNQTIGGIEVEDSYVKKLTGADGTLHKVQAYVETSSVSKLNLVRWQLAQKNKDSILKNLLHIIDRLKTLKKLATPITAEKTGVNK